MLFIWQLPKNEQLAFYKRIKARLIFEGVYTLENLENAMNSKVRDIDGLI